MEDELNQKSSSQKDVGEHGAESDSGGKHANERKQQSTPVIVAIVAALEFLALVFWMLAVDVFHKEETWILHSAFLTLAGSFFLIGAAHAISEVLMFRRLVWIATAALCVAFAVLVFTYSRPEVAHPKSTSPHVEFSVRADDFPDRWVLLTNDFLKVNHGKSERYLGLLCVPVSHPNAPQTLTFKIQNGDSPSLGEAYVRFSAETNHSIVLPNGWLKMETESKTFDSDRSDRIVKTNKVQSWAHYFGRSILKGDWESFSIGFEGPQLTQQNLVEILLRAKNCEPTSVAFNVAFFPFNNDAVHSLFVVEEKRSDGRISFHPSAEQLRDLQK